MFRRIRKILLVSVPALLAAALVSATLIEAWVRMSWDPKQGTPGFYVSDPVLGQRLGRNYDGWFAGVPVHINNLGFRDPRDYQLAKNANTFRILAVGDSVTFGHGAVYETTFPFLLENLLKQWQANVDWQVWNLGVPGYNTRQKYLYLREVAPTFKPDLVIFGFFPNDVHDNAAYGRARMPAAAARTMAWWREHMWSLEWYRRTYFTLAWRLTASERARQSAQLLADQDALHAIGTGVADPQDQQITPLDPLDDEEYAAIRCPTGGKPGPQGSIDMQRDPQWPAFEEAVRDVQAFGRTSGIPLAFFISMAPPVCPDGDFYYDDGTKYVHQVFVDLLGQDTPVITVFDEFTRLRPSQTPRAGGHALANVNLIKAKKLFEYVRNLR